MVRGGTCGTPAGSGDTCPAAGARPWRLSWLTVSLPSPVLLFHGVDDVSSPGLRPWIMPPERFAEHLGLVVVMKRAITVSQLVDGLAGAPGR